MTITQAVIFFIGLALGLAMNVKINRRFTLHINYTKLADELARSIMERQGRGSPTEGSE